MKKKKIIVMILVIILLLPIIVTPISIASSEEVNNKNNTQVEIEEDKKEVDDLDSKVPVKEIDESNIEDNKKDFSNHEDNIEKIEDSKKELEEKNDSIEVRNIDKSLKENSSLQLKASSNIQEGTYYISSVIDMNKTFDIEEQSKVNGARLQLWDKSVNKTDNQKFEIKSTGDGYYTIYAKHSGKVLDVDGARKENGTKVQQYESNGTDAQKWIIERNEDNTYSIMSKCNGLYLDIPNGEAKNGIQIQMNSNDDSNSQKFIISRIQEEATEEKNNVQEGTYYISSVIDMNKTFDIEEQSKVNGARLQLWDKSVNKTDNQKFEIKSTGDGCYTIYAKHSGKVLDVDGARKENGTKVQQYESNGTDAQKWIIERNEDNTYSIMSKCNGLYLDIPGGSATNGIKLQVYEGNGSNAQRFRLTKTDEELVGKQTIQDGKYKIKMATNTKIGLDIESKSTINGANVQLWSEPDIITKNQRFEVEYKGEGYYEIKAQHSGKVLDVAGGGTTNGSNVQQYEKNGTDAQKWIIKDNEDGTYSIISKKSRLYLDVKNGTIANGSNVQIYEGNGSNAQKFIFEKIEKERCEKILEEGIYKINTGISNNKVLDIDGGKIENSANLQIWDRSKVQQQKFQVTYNEEGYYEIKAVHSGKVLDVKGGASNNGTNVQQYESNGSEAQKWILQRAGNGYYYILSRGAESYLDVAGGVNSNGANLQIYDGNESLSQKFKFEKIQIIDDEEYNIITKLDNNKAIDVDIASSNVQIWTLNRTSKNQRFELKYLGEEAYKIICSETGKVLTVRNGNVVQEEYKGTENQKWKIEIAEDGYYYIKSKREGLYLDVFGANPAEGANIHVYEGNKTNAQKFKFEIYELMNKSNFSGMDTSKYPGYKEALTKLQEAHPNWTIKLVYTGLDWNTVLNEEEGYSNGEPYSLTQKDGEWRNYSDSNSYQGGGWHKASRKAIAYMMDPRNSLDQYYVFQFQNLSRLSNETLESISNITNGKYLQSYASTIVSASENYNVSAFHLASRMLLEQGNNGWCINGYLYNNYGTMVTVYNFANIKATGKTRDEIIANGSKYAFEHKWFTPEACIYGTAEYIYNNYLKDGQNTKYFEKYNVVVEPYYTNQYMQNIRAANDEGNDTAIALDKSGLLNTPYEFLIPVYENMPQEASARPSN